MTFKLKRPDSLVLKSTNNNNLEAINTPVPKYYFRLKETKISTEKWLTSA